MPLLRPSRLLPPGLLACLLSFAAVAAAGDAEPSPPGATSPAGSRWILDAGETPAAIARLLYPGNAALQARFVDLVRAANPQLGDRPPAGTEITVPDLRRVLVPDSAVAPASPTAARPAADDEGRSVLRLAPPLDQAPRQGRAEPELRLATRLDGRGASGDAERQLLRLEYRLIAAIADQARSQREIIERLQLLERTQDSLRQIVASPSPAAGERPPIVLVPSPAPVAIAANLAAAPLPAAELPAPASGSESRQQDFLVAASGLAAAVLALAAAALFARRRWPVAAVPGAPRRQALPPAAALAPLLPDPTPTLPPAARRGDPPGNADTEDRSVVELAGMMLDFGRVTGAAEVLRRYIASNPGEALKPWVMLLDVYRRAGMAGEFEQAAWRLHKHFNVQVEDWDHQANLSFVPHSLESYTHIIAEATSKWRTPECLSYLHRLLRDNRAGQRNGFAREVAEEIMLLVDILESDPSLKAATSSAAAAADKTSQRREP